MDSGTQSTTEPISDALNTQEHLIEELTGAVDNLKKRIDLVLSSNDTLKMSKDDNKPIGSPLLLRLQGNNSRLRDLIRTVSDTTNQVEL